MATQGVNFDWESSESPTFDPVAILGMDVVRDFGFPNLSDWRVRCSEEGRPLKAATSAGERREYRYDAAFQLVEIENQGGSLLVFQRGHDSDGQTWIQVRGNKDLPKPKVGATVQWVGSMPGTRTTFAYDADGRPVSTQRSS